MKTIINLANVIKGNLSSSSMRLLHMSLYHNPPYIIENWLNIEAITCQKQRCSSFQANNIDMDKGNVVSSRGKTKVATKSIKERPLSEEQKRKRNTSLCNTSYMRNAYNPGNYLMPKVLDFNPFGVLTPNRKVKI